MRKHFHLTNALKSLNPEMGVLFSTFKVMVVFFKIFKFLFSHLKFKEDDDDDGSDLHFLQLSLKS